MARAGSTIYQSPRAVFVMAEYLAGKEVKHRLWAQGVKVNQVAMSEIKALARGYIIEHPEIVEKAKSWCEELHQKELVKRERQRQRRLMKRQCQYSYGNTNTPASLGSMIAGKITND